MHETDLTPDEWQRAQALARSLAHDVDRNELGKIISYMRRERDPRKVHILLQRLPQSAFIRSNRTAKYLTRIASAWSEQLSDLAPRRAELVASWAFRLMTFYQREERKTEFYR